MFRISEVAAELGVSQSTVRRLAERFGAHLAPPTSDRRGRRYSDGDVETLRRIHALRADGRSDDEIDAALAAPEATNGGAPGEALALPPQVAAVLGSALQQLSETQQALLATQQAHREAIASLLDESGALKDENERLRRRLRMMEEEMSQLKESDWAQRVTLEERLNHIERGAESRPWWERLFRR